MFLESLLLFLFFSTVIMVARKPRAIANKEGVKLNSPKLSNPQQAFNRKEFTVSTFNIQTGKSLTGKRDINRSAQAIKNADLIGIQEVYAANYLQLLGIGISQVKTLANSGNFNWLFCASQTRWLREHRGNLLLSKLPVLDWKIEMLPNRSGGNFRNMTVAKVIWQDQSFYFINTHLQTRHGKEEQLESVLEEFSKYSKVILVGDFNARPHTPKLVELLKDKNVTDPLGVMKVNADEENRVDWVLTKGFQIHNAQMIEKGISDHPYYEVTVSFIE